MILYVTIHQTTTCAVVSNYPDSPLRHVVLLGSAYRFVRHLVASNVIGSVTLRMQINTDRGVKEAGGGTLVFVDRIYRGEVACFHDHHGQPVRLCMSGLLKILGQVPKEIHYKIL